MNKKILKRIAYIIVGAVSLLALFQNFTTSKNLAEKKPELSQLNRMPSSSDKTKIDFNQLTNESSQLETDLARKMKSYNSESGEGEAAH